MSRTGPRYAIYFAPETSSPLWCFGCSVLGYDAATSQNVGFARMLEDECPEWPELTEDPRKYGFHATLKAPFYLRDGVDEDELVDAVKTYAASERRFTIPQLKIAGLSRFVALVPSDAASSEALRGLASRVTTALDSARAPLSPEDLARRLKSPLTERQTQYLDQFGYPYVHEEFRFHMTLSGPLPPDVVEDVQIGLTRLYEAEVPAGTVAVDRLAIFKQDTSEARFRILVQVPLP
jgi:putative phosphonate metabolism protein